MGRSNRRKSRRDRVPLIDLPSSMVCDDYGDPLAEPAHWLELPWIGRQLCRHWRHPVEIEPDVTVYASAYLDRPREPEFEWPDVGVYLSERWAEEVPLVSFGWTGPIVGPHAQKVILPCPDGGTPLYIEDTERVFVYALNSARAGRRVEIGCHAGHGRTGMALAALMVLAGASFDEAMERTWVRYCEHAIESAQQERYLANLARRLGVRAQ